jgi:membrane carboxypeptidase/penicillin-binding protein
MQSALKSDPEEDFQVPDGIAFVNIDSRSGKLSTKSNAVKEAFIAGTEPGAARAWTQKIGNETNNESTDETNSVPNQNNDSGTDAQAQPTAVAPASEEDEFLKEQN